MTLADIDWGTAPEWVAAIGTTGALIVALLVLKGELGQRHEQEQERRRDQASRVAAWLEYESVDVTGVELPMVLMKNASESPVFMTEVLVHAPAGFDHGDCTVGAKSLPPNHTTRLRLPPGEWLFGRLWFTDAAGRHWQRHAGGLLVEVEEEPPWQGCD